MFDGNSKNPIYVNLTKLFQVNKSLPQNYDFEFVVEEISNINDKGIKLGLKEWVSGFLIASFHFPAQTISISMYFGVSWLEPRLVINETASEWTEIKTGPPGKRFYTK